MKLAKILVALLLLPAAATAQDGWLAQADKAESEQPHWASPLVTTTSRLTQRVRYEQLWQTNSKGITTNNFDGGKGVDFIPIDRVEMNFYLPPYLDHNDPAVTNGFGDVAFLLKYRLLSANERRGNYILSAFFGWSLPTGSHSNGKPDAVITPSLAYGKGAGSFDVQGTFGVAMPTADTRLIGRNYLWNNTLQYRLFRKFWPEVEVNSTFIQQGPSDGKKQTFVTPGLMIGRISLAGRLSLNIGGGFQIAATHYHTTNHNGILSVSLPF